MICTFGCLIAGLTLILLILVLEIPSFCLCSLMQLVSYVFFNATGELFFLLHFLGTFKLHLRRACVKHVFMILFVLWMCNSQCHNWAVVLIDGRHEVECVNTLPWHFHMLSSLTWSGWVMLSYNQLLVNIICKLRV